MLKPLILGWDIECTNLNADWGYVVCAGIKEIGTKKPTKIFKITDYSRYKKDPTDDSFVLQDLYAWLTAADIWVTWYGKRFDVKYVQSRLLKHKMNPLPPTPHIDGWETARYKMKLSSNRLASVTSFLGLQDKTLVKSGVWARAQAGHKPSLNYIYHHCKVDCEVLGQVYDRIKTLITTHPNVNIISGEGLCPVCGSSKVQKRGYSIAGVSRSKRYHCQECGAWSRGKPERVRRIEIR